MAPTSPKATSSVTLTPSPVSPKAATLASSPPRGSPPSPRKQTSSPRLSPKKAIVGMSQSALPKTPSRPSAHRAPTTDGERISASLLPGDFGLSSARRASLPTKYQNKDLSFGPAFTRPISPAPSAAGDSERSVPAFLPPRDPKTTTPTSSLRSTANPPSSFSASRPPRSAPAPPASTEAASLLPSDGALEAPPTYDKATEEGGEQKMPRTEWLIHQLYTRLETLVFNLPGPLYKPVSVETFKRKGRADLVNGKTIQEVGNYVFAHSRTWNASRCNVELPTINPHAKTVTCKVLSDSPHFESPTHLLVLTTGVADNKTYTAVPVHDIVYMAQCVGLKSGFFPPSRPQRVQEEDGSYSVTLPVVTLHIPANHCFGLLDDYFYHRNLTYFFQQLVSPVLPNPKEKLTFENNYARCQHYVRLLLQTFSFPQIARRLLAIHHLHQDALHIGVVDPAFWRVVNVAWFCCGAALKGKKGEMERAQALKDGGKQGAGRSASMPQLQI